MTVEMQTNQIIFLPLVQYENIILRLVPDISLTTSSETVSTETCSISISSFCFGHVNIFFIRCSELSKRNTCNLFNTEHVLSQNEGPSNKVQFYSRIDSSIASFVSILLSSTVFCIIFTSFNCEQKPKPQSIEKRLKECATLSSHNFQFHTNFFVSRETGQLLKQFPTCLMTTTNVISVYFLLEQIQIYSNNHTKLQQVLNKNSTIVFRSDNNYNLNDQDISFVLIDTQ